MQEKILLDRIQGCLMGAAIGDAMGMPVETLWTEQILERTNGHGITGFHKPLQQRIKDTKDLKPGATTDDWQLTRAVARSLIRTRNKFRMFDCATEHVREYNKSLFGWGKTTTAAILDIKEGRRNLDQPPHDLGPGKGCGNGIVMKVAPIGIVTAVQRYDDITLWNMCRSLGSMTHPDIRASIAAYPVALFVSHLLKDQITDVTDQALLLRAISDTEVIEVKSVAGHDVSERLSKLEFACDSAENLRKTVGCGFHAVDTVAFTIGTFLRHPTNFREGVLEAVNAGGDTDTNASVVGALIGANCGLEAIPAEWRNFNPAFAEALELGTKLCK